jgi:creatinine amidohydrolase
MAILHYEKLSFSELSALKPACTAVFLPVGPLEQHGPHLPYGTDALMAGFFSHKIALELQSKMPDWDMVIFPTLYAGSDTLIYRGTIEVKPSTLYAILHENCKHLAKSGFKNLIVVGAHGGPRHMVVLEEISAKIRWRYKARMISASAKALCDILAGKYCERIVTRLEKTGVPISEQEKEALKTDYHGGMLETSLMLAVDPSLVKPEYKQLKPAIVNSFLKLNRKSGMKVAPGLGYLGSPALASEALGKTVIELLIEEMSPRIERFLKGERNEREFRSWFYYVPFFRTHFKLLLYSVLWFVIMAILWRVMNSYWAGLFQ